MGHYGPGFPPAEHIHRGWWGVGHPFVALLMFLIVIGLIVWAVLYVTSHRASPAAAPAGPPPRDPALEELRIRYARGEMAREEFVERSHDLGGGPPAGFEPPAAPPPADAPAGDG
jgi:putative membrane protein